MDSKYEFVYSHSHVKCDSVISLKTDIKPFMDLDGVEYLCYDAFTLEPIWVELDHISVSVERVYQINHTGGKLVTSSKTPILTSEGIKQLKEFKDLEQYKLYNVKYLPVMYNCIDLGVEPTIRLNFKRDNIFVPIGGLLAYHRF